MEHLRLLIDNNSTVVTGKLRGELYQAFKREMGYIPEDFIWRQQSQANDPTKQWMKNWDGTITTVCYNREKCRCSIKKDGMHFPTGLYSRAAKFFRDNNVSFDYVDLRNQPSKREFPLELATDITPHFYQKDAIEKAVNNQRGLIKIATGGGKTVVGAGIIAALGVRPAIFYVTSRDLLLQAKSEIERFVRLSGQNIEVGAVGGGFKKVRDITVMTVQTAIRACGEKYLRFDEEDEDDKTEIDDIKKDVADLIHSAKLCICDEVQHWRAETCQVIADHSFSCFWRYGMSATPWRDAGDDILIDACFGKLICDINASFLIRHGFLVKPYISFIPIKNMKGQKLGPWATTYRQGIVENMHRNEWIANLAQNLVQNNRMVLVLVQQITHGEILNAMIPNSVFMHGQSGGKKRKEHIELMRSGKAPVTISSTIFDEGIDVRPLNSLILAGGGKSATRALQRIGRVIRPFTYPDGTKKEDAYVYDLWDHLKYCTSHSMSRRKIYLTEDQFEVEMAEV